jgi:hypothetical protein
MGAVNTVLNRRYLTRERCPDQLNINVASDSLINGFYISRKYAIIRGIKGFALFWSVAIRSPNIIHKNDR